MSGDTIRGRIGGLHLALAALNGVSAGELGNRTKSHRLTQLGGCAERRAGETRGKPSPNALIFPVMFFATLDCGQLCRKPDPTRIALLVR